MRHFLNTSFFDDKKRMVDLISRHGVVKRLTRAGDARVERRTHCETIEELEDMVASYRSAARRKGVPTSLEQAMLKGERLPTPIIMQRYKRMFVIGGNTRLDVAEILDVQPDPKILFVNLDLPEIQDMLENYPR